MNVQITIRHMNAGKANKDMVLELCNEVQDRFSEVTSIGVIIDDVNGPHKSGIDKCCHLKVRGKENISLDIYDIDADVNCAIESAFSRLTQSIKRVLDTKQNDMAHLSTQSLELERSIA